MAWERNLSGHALLVYTEFSRLQGRFGRVAGCAHKAEKPDEIMAGILFSGIIFSVWILTRGD